MKFVQQSEFRSLIRVLNRGFPRVNADRTLPFQQCMKVKKRYIFIWLLVCLLILASGVAVGQKTQNAALAEPVVVSPADKAAIDAFEKQVKEFIDLRNKARASTPKLSKDSTPEQIHAYRTALAQSMRNARPNAKRGELFLPATADFIRRTLKTEFQGKDRQELRETVFETETQGVVLRVNYPNRRRKVSQHNFQYPKQ